MACRDAYKNQAKNSDQFAAANQSAENELLSNSNNDKLLFGVDSKVKSDCVLQNNLTEFDWAARNK